MTLPASETDQRHVHVSLQFHRRDGNIRIATLWCTCGVCVGWEHYPGDLFQLPHRLPYIVWLLFCFFHTQRFSPRSFFVPWYCYGRLCETTAYSR